MSKSPFKEGMCHWPGCNVPTILRPDGIPLCSKHEKHITEEVKKMVPKLAEMPKLKLHTRLVKG